MTISRKLIIALTLALGIQFSAGASSYKDEERARGSIILVYAQDLLNQDNKQAQTVAKWLNAEVISGCYSHEAIINVITNQKLTEQTKLMLFSEMIARQKNAQKDARIAGICGTILFTGIFGTLAWVIINQPRCPGRSYSQVNVFELSK